MYLYAQHMRVSRMPGFFRVRMENIVSSRILYVMDMPSAKMNQVIYISEGYILCNRDTENSNDK